MSKKSSKGPPKKTLFLIDGSSYIYRAYHAVRDLSTKEGFPTNAIYGFTNMLLKVLREQEPDYVAMVLDSPGPTHRHEIFPDYKANRPPMPDDLRVQIPRIEDLSKAFNIATLRLDGYEADDIIATLVDRFSEDVDDIVIVSSDKDFMQLVSQGVRMLDTMKDRWIGIDDVKERFGVDPEHVPDVLALIGDSSDNVPGLTGVGPKTAGKLISRFGDLESLFEHSDEITGKVGENLSSEADTVRLSFSLVTLDREVPLDVTLDNLSMKDPDDEALRTIFSELQFTRFLKDLSPKSSLDREGYRLVLTEHDLSELVTNLDSAGAFALDVETDSRDPIIANLVGISFSWEQGQAAYIPLAHRYLGVPDQLDTDKVKEALSTVLADPKKKKIGQNIKYDLQVLSRAGWPLEGIEFDTMVASYLVNPSRRSHSLTEIAAEYFNHTMISFKDVAGSGKKQIPFYEVHLEDACEYACEDSDVTYRAADLLGAEVKNLELSDLFRDVEMPLVQVLAQMELAGILLDTGHLAGLFGEVNDKLSALEGKIHREAGRDFNINSPRQLGQILFEELGLPVIKKTKTGYSTNADVLLELSEKHQLPAMVLDYRSLAKLKSTYIDSLPGLVNPETGRIHTSFNQAATATGRLSSSDPNLQNIPVRTELGRRIREAFIAPEGSVLLCADYSQIELRVLAHLSRDERLLAAFGEDGDIHKQTAREILGASQEVEPELRRRAKVVNFGIIYGMSAFGLGKELGIHPKEAADIISSYFETYSGVKEYIDRTLAQAAETGYVTTLSMRRRYLPELGSSNPNIRQLAERMAVNTPIQGTAADLIKIAMLHIQDQLKKELPEAMMLLQVHDELVFEVPEDKTEQVTGIVRPAMEGVMELAVPLVVDIGIGRNWTEAH
ncbi:MAG: DNA polymerase I [bacterium]